MYLSLKCFTFDEKISVLKKVRYATITWIAIIPIVALIKIFWELNTPNANHLLPKPYPVSLLDSQFPANIFIGISLILIATYVTYAYINAYIRLQNTYAVSLFFGSLTLLTYTPELTSTLVAVLLFMIGILKLLSLNEKKKSAFTVFDTGLFIGLTLIFDIHFIILGITLSFFLFLFRFSFKEFVQYWAGMIIPALFLFPILYFYRLLPEWENYFSEISKYLLYSPELDIIDYILIGIIFILGTVQAIRLYNDLRKPRERLLLLYLLVYFIISLLIGIFAHQILGAYILFIIPPLTILYSLSRHSNHTIPEFIASLIVIYLGYQFLNDYSSLL